ncbi:hypothetical protein GGF43_000777 [Coemansia sp. RSA 2618]|nr:hypothetical protein GGF43_000777 [Coemansia sp. RSA 2618]
MNVGRFHTSATRSEATQFTMPALSPTMTEGGIARWEKKEGEAFSAGDLLLQIETDKAQMDVEAQDDGVLVKILAPEGAQNVKVNSPIAIIAEEGDDVASIDIGAMSKQQAVKEESKSEAKPETKAETKPEAKPEVKTEIKTESKGLSSPAAEFAIHANHISNAAEIEGSGPKGRVLKGDVLRFLKDGRAKITKPAASTTAAPAKPATAAKPAASAAQKLGADSETAFLVQSLEPSVLRHLAQLELAKQSVVVSVPFERLAKLIRANKALTVDAFAVRAIALAMHQVPIAKDGGSTVGVATGEGAKVAEVAEAATTGVLDLAAAIKRARKDEARMAGAPAVVLAAENVFTPSTLPGSAVVVVGSPYAAVSSADASAALDSALDELIGGPSAVSSAQPPQKPASSLIDVRVISSSPVAAAFASKIKGFLSNPELLTF